MEEVLQVNVQLSIGKTQLFWRGVAYIGTAIPGCNLMIQVIFVYNDKFTRCGFNLMALHQPGVHAECR